MKKTILSLFALLASFEVGNAQVSGMNIGYCYGKLGTFPSTSDSFFADLSTKKNTWTSAAIKLSAERVKNLKGNEIREIRAGLVSKLNVDSLAVWVSESLDGPVLSTDTITKLEKGWDTIPLTKKVVVTDQMQSLYIGYSYHQKSTAKAMSCRQAAVPGYSCFIRSGNGEWTDYSNSLTACVEALVYGDNLPKYDLALQSLSVQEHYVVDKGTLDLKMQVRNNATVTISGFDIVCAFDGIDEKYTVHCDSSLAYNESKTISATIQPKAIQSMVPADRTVTVTIDNLVEGRDEVMSDNTLSASFDVTLHSYDRNVLLEEFTTEKCTNCPRVAGYVHEAMNEPEFKGHLNTMENHVGYYTDMFTTAFHNEWGWLFDDWYAPGIMYDRYAAEGKKTAVSNPSSKQELFDNIRKELRKTAFVSLKIEADVDGNNQKINVKVTGSRAKEAFTINPPRITVVLTETNLKAISQAGAGADYTHYNVGRRVNSNWGDVIEWDGDNYTYECSLPYTKDFDMDNLGILAFVHDYDPEDKTKCDVANSAAITSNEFTGKATGITSVEARQNGEQIYTLAGRKVNGLQHGVNIVVRDGKSIKVIK